MTNIAATYDVSGITIQNVALSSQMGQGFSVAIGQTGPDTLQAEITGYKGQFTRTIRVNFNFSEAPNPVFDFGVASRGPLRLMGNAKLLGLDFASQANVYVESENEDEALFLMGNSRISGDAGIANPDAYAAVIGNSSIGGERGQDAIDNHVSFGIETIRFPATDTSAFEQYVQNVINDETVVSGNLTFQNVRILAGVNPSFSGNISFNGIIFIESPNIVAFTGNITITGLIVADGDVELPVESDSLTFQGNLFCYDVSCLPDTEDFAGLKDQSGTFLLVPGFSAGFTGNFHTINGAIAASGVSFSGNAGGTVKGSILNYSEESMQLTGNTTITFDRIDSEGNPAGFQPDAALEYTADSYSEIVL